MAVNNALPVAPAYDASILRQYATGLYRQAQWLVARYTITGAVLGGFFGPFLRLATEELGVIETMLGGVIAGALMGYSHARGRAFQLRLEAQRTLCQVQIEANTRPH